MDIIIDNTHRVILISFLLKNMKRIMVPMIEYFFVQIVVIALCILGTIVLRRISPIFFSIAMGNRFERKKAQLKAAHT